MKEKIESRRLYELARDRGMSAMDAANFVSFIQLGPKMYEAQRLANENPDLMPEDCLNILEEVYGYRKIRNFKRETLYNKVYFLMKVELPDPDPEMINDSVNSFLDIQP